MLMQRSRAAFKLALRYCRQHEEILRADVFAKNFADKDYNQFWKSIRQTRNDAAYKHAHSVGGIVGESNIANF